MNFISKIRIQTMTVIIVLAIGTSFAIALASAFYLNSQTASVSSNWENFSKGPLSKSIILSNLRNTLGYGGVIHNFKNYVLRKDRKLILKVEEDILEVIVLLTAYKNIGLSSQELAAINVLSARIEKYRDAIATAEEMSREGHTSIEIDNAVKVDDSLAIQALLELVNELEQSYAEESERIDQMVSEVELRSSQFIVAMFLLGAFSILLVLWFMSSRVITPINMLSNSMDQISRKKISEPVSGTDRSDEIGDMARMVEKFRKVMEERRNLELSLVEAGETAVAANDAKTEFLETMSHELRTPLNGIIGLTEMMQQGTFGPLANEKYEEYINEVNKSGVHLLNLVQSILDVVDAEDGKAVFEETDIDLFDIVDECVSDLKKCAEKQKVAVQNNVAKDIFIVRVDKNKIRKAFDNILNNGIKFTPENGNISIDAFHEKNGGINISITDTGIGMQQRSIDKALLPFGQVDRGTFTKHEGVGLGLYITRLIIELHEGDLLFASTLGSGTRVTISLPANRVIR